MDPVLTDRDEDDLTRLAFQLQAARYDVQITKGDFLTLQERGLWDAFCMGWLAAERMLAAVER